jgi:hypothetical protein
MGAREEWDIEEPYMISPAGSGIAAIALAVVLMGPADSLAQSKVSDRPNDRAIVPPRPPMRAQQGLIVPPIAGPIVAPIGSAQLTHMPLQQAVPNHPFDRDRDREHRHDDDRGAFAAGIAAGVVLGGALASPSPGIYYAPAPSPIDDPVGYCAWMYSSYDPQSGTYIGDDGAPHPCPP